MNTHGSPPMTNYANRAEERRAERPIRRQAKRFLKKQGMSARQARKALRGSGW